MVVLQISPMTDTVIILILVHMKCAIVVMFNSIDSSEYENYFSHLTKI